MNSPAGDVIVLVTVLGWVLIAAIGGSAGVSAAEDPIGYQTGEGERVEGGPVPMLAIQAQDGPAQDDVEDEETTERHRNPDDYSERGDLERVEKRLSEWLLERLREGAIELDEGEYELASERVDERYDDRVEQYAEIADETDGEHYADAFEGAGAEHARLTAAVREYETTNADYDAALANDEQALAHELARDLDRLTGEIDNASRDLHGHYSDLEEGTGADLSAAETAIEAVVEDVRHDQHEVRESQFVETELTIVTETESESISFRDPLVAAGELRTVDGEPVADETVRFDVGPTNETVTTETAADGSFEFTYRPVTAPLSTTTLSVRYVPDHGSPYLESETTVDVSIEQVEPTVTIRERPGDVSSGDELAVAGTLTVGDVPVDEGPLVVTLDGRELATVPVSNGSFEGSGIVPVSATDGERELRVSLPFEDRNQSLAAASVTEPVTVLETESEMSIRATRTGDDTVQVRGWLATADGEAVANQSVELRLENATAGRVTTGTEGTFETTVPIPDSIADGDRLEADETLGVRAVYDGTDASLAPVQAETTATASRTASGAGSLSQPLPIWGWIGVGLLGTTAVVIGVRRYRRPAADDSTNPDRDERTVTDGRAQERPETESPSTASPARAPSGSSSPSPPPAPTPTPARTRSRLEAAADLLSNDDPDPAVERCYEAVRGDLEARIGAESGQTHWEFFRRYRDSPASELEDLNTLRALTEGYERAVFDRQGNTTSEAERLLEQARHLCTPEFSTLGGDYEQRTAETSPE